MAKTHSCSKRIIHGHIYVHPQENVRQIFTQTVSLRQLTNIIYHVYISNNKNKHFSHKKRLSFIFRSSDSSLLLFTPAHAYGPRQANLCLRAFCHENFNCAYPAIQRGQGSCFLSEGSSWLIACMSEQRRFWRDCADARARLNLRCSLDVANIKQYINDVNDHFPFFLYVITSYSCTIVF